MSDSDAKLIPSKAVIFEHSTSTELAMEGGTMTPPFESVRELLENTPPPRRPNRAAPIDRQLDDELNAWEAASDETLENFERGLSE